jgi:glycine/D-amino acid oxidase-like deaminating enzyme
MTSTATANLPTPDFTLPFRCVSGLRPFREGGYRLEPERPAAAPQKFIVHNYGHGGAGITMSWGTASKVRDLVRNHLATTSDRTVAVLGSGVMGLTAATLLLDLGVQVKIYAEHFWKDTTSAVAGGQWAASKVEFSDPNAVQGDPGDCLSNLQVERSAVWRLGSLQLHPCSRPQSGHRSDALAGAAAGSTERAAPAVRASYQAGF